MKRITFTICAAFILLACNNSTTAESTNTSDTGTNTSTSSNAAMPDSATMMRNWQAYMTPSEPHKMMASWDGTWVGDMTMWMAPGAPPTKSTTTSVNKMVMGGRYQQSTHTGDFMGSPFNGMSTMAYDNIKKVFISTWIDNMGTGVMVMEGPWDSTSKTITLKGKMVDPGVGKEIDVRETFRVIDNNNTVMEMYGAGPDGKEMKTMEIKYKRKN
ncbi:MAG: DUF1579 domain-containing protein [Chitinophagaceae bacterium]